MSTTIKFPLELLNIQVNSANAYWTSKSGANIDIAHVSFVDSGEGVSFYWGYVPNNLFTTPAWNIDIGHYADSGSGGNVVLSVSARAISNNAIDTAPVLLSSTNAIATNTSGTYTYSSVSGGNFDSVVAISATNIIIVKINRHGGHASDTVNAIWDLQSVIMRADIT